MATVECVYKYRGWGFAVVDTLIELPDYEANHMCGINWEKPIMPKDKTGAS